MNITVEAVSVGDEKIFEIFIGERVLKKDVFNSTGNIPLYSANVFQPFGQVEKSNISDFEHDCILWGIDSNFEFRIIHKGEPFATTDHCGVIRILNDDIIPEYVVYRLQQIRYDAGFDRSLRASLKNMRRVTIDIPTTFGKFNREIQETLVKKYTFVNLMRSDIATRLSELQQAIVEPSSESGMRFIDISLDDQRFFKLQRGKRITQKDCYEHPGVIPVISGRREKHSYLGHVSEDWLRDQGIPVFDRPIIVIAANGSVGSVFLRDEPKFTIHDDAIGIIPQTPELVPDYLQYSLRNAATKSQPVFNAKLYQKRLRELSVSIPSKTDDSIDIDKQKELASNFQALDILRKKLNALSDTFADNVVVSF